MPIARCEICGTKIIQRESVVRVVVEIAEKAKSDKTNNAEDFTAVKDWVLVQIFHEQCARELLEPRRDPIEVRCEQDMCSLLFDNDNAPDDPPPRDLSLVK